MDKKPVEHCANYVNIMTTKVATNCPQGGNHSHGGVTVVELVDEACTFWEVSRSTHEWGDLRGVRLVLRGDSECAALIESLRFAADELERQWLANGGAKGVAQGDEG